MRSGISLQQPCRRSILPEQRRIASGGAEIVNEYSSGRATARGQRGLLEGNVHISSHEILLKALTDRLLDTTMGRDRIPVQHEELDQGCDSRYRCAVADIGFDGAKVKRVLALTCVSAKAASVKTRPEIVNR